MARTPFKMNGFSGFGNSPLKHDVWKKEKVKRDKEGNIIKTKRRGKVSHEHKKKEEEFTKTTLPHEDVKKETKDVKKETKDVKKRPPGTSDSYMGKHGLGPYAKKKDTTEKKKDVKQDPPRDPSGKGLLKGLDTTKI